MFPGNVTNGYGARTVREPNVARLVWVLADDRAGNRSQALGVADALGRPYEVKDLAYGPLARLPNGWLPPSFAGLTPASRASLGPPWPDLVIAAGRRTAGVARRIKRLAKGASRLVQIMNPGGPVADFDLLCVPGHDPPVVHHNALTITGAPHGLTPAVLEQARSRWMAQLERLPAPRIALIVGGSTRRRRFTEAMAVELAAAASSYAAARGGALMVTTSRRTGEASAALRDNLSGLVDVYDWRAGGEENPYQGYLACSDMIIVTGESVSMCSEACASTVPVFVFAPESLITAKHARFHQALFDAGYAQPFAPEAEGKPHAPLNPARDIAEGIRKLKGS